MEKKRGRRNSFSSPTTDSPFEWRERTEGRVMLENWSPGVLIEVLRFMYLGEAKVSSVAAAQALVLAAMEFAMDELKGKVVHLLARQLDQRSCLEMLRWAGVENNVPELVGPCLQAVRAMKVESREEAEGLLRLAADLGALEGDQLCGELRAIAFERVSLSVRADNCLGLLVRLLAPCVLFFFCAVPTDMPVVELWIGARGD